MDDLKQRRSVPRELELQLRHLPAVSNWLRYADPAKAVNRARHHPAAADKLDGMVHENVIAQLANLRTHPSVAAAVAQGRLRLHGWVYDLGTGQVDALDSATRRFVSTPTIPSSALPAHLPAGRLPGLPF